jgi:ABC-type sugar transport system permease subunit
MAVADLSAVADTPAPRTGSLSRRARNLPVALVFLSPALLVIGVFHFYPLFYAFYISLHQWRIRKVGYIGLDNYRTALETEQFWMSFMNTLWFAIITVPVTMVIASCWPTCSSSG